MRRGDGRQGGFTLVVVLVALFLLALASEAVMRVVSQQAQREREERLLQVGQAYQRAIGTYYESSPGSVKQWPRVLDDLVDDRRFVGIRRHLRELYADPVARSAAWGLIREPDGGISGVYSLAEGQPLLEAAGAHWADPVLQARRFADWRFAYRPVSGQVQGALGP